jgi:hypothetical protein
MSSQSGLLWTDILITILTQLPSYERYHISYQAISECPMEGLIIVAFEQSHL